MSEAALLKVLRTSTDARRILEADFDFRVLPSPPESSLFRLRNGTGHEEIGADGSGGEFVLCDAGSLGARPLLYVSSEGQAGVIAQSLEKGLSLIVDLPYWKDCLHFSAGGQIAEMRRVVSLSEDDLIARTPHIPLSRQAMRKLFGLSSVSDSLEELQTSVHELSPLYPVCSPDGWQFEPLFGKFTAMSNGEWRRRLQLQK